MITIISITAITMMIGTMIAAAIGPVRSQESGWGRGLRVTVYIKQVLIFL